MEVAHQPYFWGTNVLLWTDLPMAAPSVDVEQILRVLSTLLSPDQAVELAT